MIGRTNSLIGSGATGNALIRICTIYGSIITISKNGVVLKQYAFTSQSEQDTTTSYYYYSFPVLKSQYGEYTIVASTYYGSFTKTVTVENPYQYLVKFVPRFTYTPYRLFESSNLTSSGWVDSINSVNLTKNNGNWRVSDSKLYLNGSDRFSTTTSNSYFLFGIRCSIDSSFTPVNTANWYQQSCIMGQEISNTQNDYGMTIVKSGNDLYLAVGYSASSYTTASIPITTGEDHTLFLLHITDKYYLWQDGELVATVSYKASGTNVTTPGIFWNKSGTGTTVKGTISKIGFWTYTETSETDGIIGVPIIF